MSKKLSDIVKTKIPKVVYHYTNDEEPKISTKEERLIPNSISTAPKRHSSNIWGKNKFEMRLHDDAKILHVNLKPNPPGTHDKHDFWKYGKETDTPINRGKEIHKFATKHGYHAVYLTGAGHGNEMAIIHKNIKKL